MPRASFVILVFAPWLAACGVPSDEHQLTVRELENAKAELEVASRRIAELEAEVARLSETDEAYWQAVVELREQEQWPEVRSKISKLLERWQQTQYAVQARRFDQEALEAMASRLYKRAQAEMRGERFESAKSILVQVRDDFPGTRPHSQALADVKGLDRQIEQARRRAIGSGKWRVSSQTSPIDDSTNVHLSLQADSSISGRFGETVRPSLRVRCKENRTEVFVAWELYLGIDTTQVLHRLDDRRAQTRTWGVSTDHEATFYRGNHVSFARELMNHERLLLQTTPYGEKPVTATFSIVGLENAAIPLREACRW